jgi:radical SAM protein with 4Fe4S-binding SPASM domain
METIPQGYKWHRRVLQLTQKKPSEAIRWVKAELLSFGAKRREEFPITLAIEVTNHCNKGCPTCPQPRIADEKGFLRLDLFQSVVDECCRVPTFTSLVFTGFGEPLLHPELIHMGCYAKSKMIPIVRTYTNCVLLDEKNSEEILSSSGFDEITLSLNGPTPETYERMKRDRDYTLVTNNIEYFLRRKKVLGRRTPLVNLQLLRLNNVPLDTGTFAQRWAPLLGAGDCIVVKDSHSFAGQVDDPRVGGLFDPHMRLPCGQLWNFLSVSWNGDVSPCCADPFKKLKIGNVGNSSLHRLWHSPRLKEMRQLHLQERYHALPLCDDCETWRYFQ